MERTALGWGNGLLGVIIFSGSLPASRVAVADFTPVFLTSARAAIAALMGICFLLLLRQQRPARGDLLSLMIVAGGVVVGFPLLSSLALERITSAHSTVYIGLLPLLTAIFGVIRGGERPKPAFWLFSLVGAATVVAFALSHGMEGSASGDLLMLAAIVVCGLGYAEGAALSRRLGGWQVISWALTLSMPVMVVIALGTAPDAWNGIHASAWLGLAYVSVFSMFIGFIFWYRGLAMGGIARVGQLQLLQPFFALILASALLGETVAWSMILSAVVVALCVASAKRFS